jgi:hypothetical protein
MLAPLLLQMSADARESSIPTYRDVAAVTLTFDAQAPQTINGTSRVAYRAGRDLAFPVAVATPKPIRRATLHWELKHAASLQVLASGHTRHERVEAGALPPLAIAAGALAELAVPEDYVLCLTLTWRDRKGATLGTRRTTMFTLAGEYQYDRAEDAPAPPPDAEGVDDETGEVALTLEPIALADPSAHRDVWHKVWEGRFTDDGRSRRIALRYYYALGDRREVARMETQQKRVKGKDSKAELRLRTGLLLSPEALNALLPALADVPSLDAEQLRAIRSPDFRRRFGQAADSHVTLRGRAGQRAALWVYPEVRLQRVILKRASEVDPNGQIASYEETAVVFPMPALAHVIGTRTER